MNTKINILSRIDMKSIKAGDLPIGNIRCKINGNEFPCDAPSLTDCTIACDDMAFQFGWTCEGCAQFP